MLFSIRASRGGAVINDVSQSAATQSVHRVEKHFGVQLVDRSKRPFVLTPEGQACYEGFREVLELYDSVEARVRSLRMDIGGLVRVASIYSVGLHDMSRCMQDFMRRYPKAKVRLEYLRPNKVYDAVVNAEVDLGIMSYPQASPDLNVIPLRSERMVLVCHPQHRLARQKAVTAEHLQGEDFVAFDRDLSIRKEVDRYLRQRSVTIRISSWSSTTSRRSSRPWRSGPASAFCRTPQCAMRVAEAAWRPFA